jgi:uncharacterized membrane protein YcaP (DUF421 family)
MEIVLRSSAIFFFIWLLTRAMGKRELAEMTAFELILLVTIGDLVQQAVTQEDMSVIGAMLAVGTIGAWILVFSYLTYRWRRTEPLLIGVPVLVIREGEPIQEALDLERVPMDEVLQAAREQGIDDLRKVKIGILESDGGFSFIKYDGEQKKPKRRKATT